MLSKQATTTHSEQQQPPQRGSKRLLLAMALLLPPLLWLGSARGPETVGFLAAGLGGLGRSRPADSDWTRPLAQSWPAQNPWSEALEDEYSRFVERLAQAVAQRRCRRLDVCLRDPESNLLYDAAVDAKLDLDVDCGDLPYVLRAYFAFKRKLPFGFVCDLRGEGPDQRYLSGVTPGRLCLWTAYGTPRSVLRELVHEVHSGMFRMAPEVENSDWYPIAINRRALRPGIVYYDPNGHVLTVGEVRADGSVFLIDGHPDGSLTWKRFGQAFALGGRAQGGGFKGFRPQRWEAQGDTFRLLRASNRELPHFDGRSQWDKDLRSDGDKRGSYHQWVRQSLAQPAVTVDAVADFREQIRSLCRDLQERVEAVQAAVAAGLPRRAHPGELPSNIYGATGDWEIYASPSRDARLKAAFRELHESLTLLPNDSPLRPLLRAAFREESAQPLCQVSYRSSAGATVNLTLDTIIERLFRLSFDPYHCPELRWGAPPGSSEAASCPDDAHKRELYLQEQRLRNRIEREYGAPTPLRDGPETPPDIDLRPHLQ